jgi:hypothetical protein
VVKILSDDAVVQIISRLGVDFNQAIISAERLAASVNMANTSLTNLNATANATRAMTIGQAGIARGQAQIASATETAAQATRRHTRSVQDLNKEYNVLGSMAERRISWFVTGSAVFGSLAALKEIASTIKDVEMGMTTIARITEDVNFNFEEMRDSLQGLGVEYGMTWENTSDIAIKWAQAGYNTADTLELTKSSLLALNTAELNATQAWAA